MQYGYNEDHQNNEGLGVWIAVAVILVFVLCSLCVCGLTIYVSKLFEGL